MDEAKEMTLNEYQELARRTQNGELNQEQRMLHALHGLAAEVGEIHGIYQKWYQGHGVDDHEIALEMGDVMWFLVELCDVLGVTLEDVARMNIEKLKKRYPEGFDAERSLNRDECNRDSYQ